MNCKNCFHYNVCEARANLGDITENAEGCKNFIDSSRVIVPPCEVGDKIFFIVNMSEHLAFNDFVTDDTVTKIGVTTKGILHEKGVDFTDFGKTVFLTREEAEAALKERGRQ